MRKLIGCFLLIGAMWLLGGRASVDYVGQTFPVANEGEYIEFYRSLREVPTDLKPIGRGTAMLNTATIDDDIYELFAEKAEEVGAVAFAIAESKQVLVGVTNEVESRPSRPNANWSVDGTDGVGRQVYTNTFGNEEELKVVKKSYYKLKVTAVFYVPIDVFNQYIGDLEAVEEEVSEDQPLETPEKTETPESQEE
jgi:hypothetical protein